MSDVTTDSEDKSGFGVIGLNSGTIGRGLRLVFGLLGIYSVGAMVYAAGILNRFSIEMVGYTVAWLVAYSLLLVLLGERVLARTNPWVGTVIFLSPVVIVLGASLGPPAFQFGLVLYISIALIFNAFMRYGGCEVVSIPSLFLGKRYTIYCPYNVIDIVEKAAGRKGSG